MVDPTFYDITLPGDIEDAGYAYGKMCRELLHGPRLAWYLDEMMRLNKTTPAHLERCAERWCGVLPARYQAQIEAMAAGAVVRPATLKQWLYADIAAAEPAQGVTAESPAALIGEAGPMCTGLVVWDDAGRPWLGRNCDWYTATVSRGTCAVRHSTPGRIPCMCVGLMGDIDADTGINAAGLWLHMHTWMVRDEPRAGTSCISWLFWMREALETCTTLGEVEAFIAQTSRDRGVFLVAVEGRTGEAAIFECSRSSYRRVEPQATASGPRLVVTNHCREKCEQIAIEEEREGPRVRRHGSTVTRHARVMEILDHASPEHHPDDVQEILADEWVEMRETCMSASLRTIYSAVCDAGRGDVWFASGAVPAASAGLWRRVRL